MADGVWKVVLGAPVFNPSTPSMRKGEKSGENSGPLTSLPVDRLNGNRLQCRRSCQNIEQQMGYCM